MEGGSLMSLVLRHLLEEVVSRKAPGVLEVSWLGVTLTLPLMGLGRRWHLAGTVSRLLHLLLLSNRCFLTSLPLCFPDQSEGVWNRPSKHVRVLGCK